MTDDKTLLEGMLKTCTELLESLKRNEIDEKTLQDSLDMQWMVTTPLYNIGEKANNLSDEFVHEHSDTPWVEIAGMRHRLVHNYEGTNWSLIWEVLDIEIPELEKSIREILDGDGFEEAAQSTKVRN